MAKVVLITSRKISCIINSDQFEKVNLTAKYLLPFYESNVVEKWSENGKRVIEAAKEHNCIKKAENLAKLIDKINGVAEENALTSDVIYELIPKVRNDKAKRSFIPGVYKKKFNDSNQQLTVYVADEYPLGTAGFTKSKQLYIESLLDIICSDCGTDINKIEGNIYSHDKDWDVEDTEETFNILKVDLKDDVVSPDFPILQSLKNPGGKVSIECFQHERSDSIYDQVILPFFQNPKKNWKKLLLYETKSLFIRLKHIDDTDNNTYNNEV